MADDRHFVPGDYYQLDDNTGFKVRAKRTRLQWNNVVTTPPHFNPRQRQDLVVGVRDDQSVPLPRPRQVNQFAVVATIVTAPASRGANSLTVESSTGFVAGNNCTVMLDSGVQFAFVVASAGSGVITWAGAGLPATVGLLYGDPIENQVLNLTSALIPPNETPSYSE